MFPPPDESNDYLAEHVRLLQISYEKFVGSRLGVSIDSSSPTAFASGLFNAPFVVLSHNTEPDPVFNYANQAAMDLFEMDWPTITRLPSRKSAEPINQADRDRLLAAVTSQNFIDDYSGVRISATGRRFFIPQATVWNLVDETGEFRGQAATFQEWEFLAE